MAYGAETEKALLIERLAAAVAARWPARRAGDPARFIASYYRDTAIEDLLQRPADDLIGAAVCHWQLLTAGGPTPRIRIYNPEPEQHGWQSTHSVVQIVADDMPFLIDSVSMALNRGGHTIHLIVHPVLPIRRDRRGQIRALADDGQSDGYAACMHFEIDRESDPSRLAALSETLREVLGDVRLAVDDWPAMRAKLQQLAEEIATGPPLPGQDRAESAAFLRWLADDHFTLLGYRCHELIGDGDTDQLREVPGSALGILRKRNAAGISRRFAALPPEVRRQARLPELLIITKSNSRATVHRPSYMDYIGIKRFDAQGEVIGEHRFLGLYTSSAYSSSPLAIPLLRRKVEEVIRRAALPPRSHAGKALLHILETYPRDELFQSDVDTLHDIAMSILHLQERQRTRLFVRHERYQRFVSCLVYAPRERYNTEVRRRMQALLEQAFGSSQSEFAVHLSESVLARIHFIIRLPTPGRPAYDHAALEALLAQTLRTWRDDLQTALLERFGEPRGNALLARYGDAFPGAYRADVAPRLAALDTERLERLDETTPLLISLYRVPEQPPELLRLKLYHRGRAIALSDLLPILENMGLTVVDERPYEVRPGERECCWIHDLGVRHSRAAALDTPRLRDAFQQALTAVWHGQAEDDGFNRLVLEAGLRWEQVVILRAYAKYLRQAGTTLSQAYIETTLARYPHIAAKLVALFHARLDPAGRDGAKAAHLAEEIVADLGAVPTLDEDRILRRFLAAIEATLRTNAFQRDAEGRRKPYLALKLAPERIPDMPPPPPKYEIYVYATHFEGVHLRGGKVARGGIRHSDRREDFRTEVLGLMKAQTVKNAVIVPVGAKGGFYPKRLPTGDREAVAAEVRRCYRDFIRGLLDLTDNRRGDAIVPPPDVARYDDDDPYLVVAADKGTATFSDLANEVAAEYGFWLGDAFASGGSAGYDHKKMGITARGAWEAVKRHFRELGLDIQRQDFTCVGIGDMSGDVFGNGMLQSRHIKLIAAFDHRHIFIDPDPDPEISYQERCRLYRLPRSSWADYDPAKLSAGGGVYPRSAKVIELSAEARRTLGTEQERFAPDELIRALLRAPVDLLWSGGIGTYCKASDESNADVGDKANDPLRVDAASLRCRVVGEGGNLGFTQRGRIECALRGVRINTDAIDNAGGVNCSDHEVNIKILLNQAVEDGELTVKQRNQLLAEMTEEVAALVLADNYQQTQALSLAQAHGGEALDEHTRFIHALERAGLLDRELEHLPDDDTLASRTHLTRPELAVLLAYAKIAANHALLQHAPLLDAPFMTPVLLGYFPRPLARDFGRYISRHRLRREITATVLANQIINRMGVSFFHRLGESLGVGYDEIARAYLAARDIFELEHWWRQVDALDNRIDADRQIRLQLALADLQEQATLWLLRNLPRPLDVPLAIERLKPQVARFWDNMTELLPAGARERLAARELAATADGVPAELARRVAAGGLLFSALDMAWICRQTESELFLVAGVYFLAAERLELDWLRTTIDAFPTADPWQERFRAGLEDEIYLQLRWLGAEVVTASGLPRAEERVEAWLERYAAQVARIRQTLAELKSMPKLELAMLAVAVQQLKQLVQAGTARALEKQS